MPVGRRPILSRGHFISQSTSAVSTAPHRNKSPARRTGMRCRATSSLFTGVGKSEMFALAYRWIELGQRSGNLNNSLPYNASQQTPTSAPKCRKQAGRGPAHRKA